MQFHTLIPLSLEPLELSGLRNGAQADPGHCLYVGMVGNRVVHPGAMENRLEQAITCSSNKHLILLLTVSRGK